MMQNARAAIILFVATLALATTPVPAAEPAKAQFDFELATQEGFSGITAQKWTQMFTELKVGGVRIRAAQPGDKLEVVARGTKAAPAFRVTGQLTAGGVLVVPGGKFGISDKAKLAKWMSEVADNGVEGVTQKKAAFGLTPSQLQAAHDDLKQPVGFSTKGLAPGEVIAKIRTQLKHKLVPDPALGTIFESGAKVGEELQGYSVGTVLAIMFRPGGAVLVPRRPMGGDVEYLITSAKGVEQHWPIGYPPEDDARKLVPTMHEFLTVEFDGAPLDEALTAIEGRLKTTFVYDQNAIVMHKVDLKQAISLPSKKTFYSKALSEVLFKAGLKNELRVDEAGKPFLWITSLKRS